MESMANPRCFKENIDTFKDCCCLVGIDAGKQIRNVIQSAYKIERRAGGLKDILGELPKREASHFRSQVSKLASEAKREKNSLAKELYQICDHVAQFNEIKQYTHMN
ncbi:hypothetical protein L195_g006094 [Trifolium pratense]|uniref:Uncharacterized protein n=1 Tax=Trifolium pratense TaxID=57577 RepID=A0A2K3P2M8_TRIPR|nr:hypothetical protein L195_g006094 [Trifolium pratense]